MDSVATTAADNGANSSPKPSAETAAPVRGILKNQTSSSVAAAAGAGAGGAQLVWDEENLTLNEVQKDSTMKITEPKTPYVRYNAETDEVMDLDKIPGFELGRVDDDGMNEGEQDEDASSPPIYSADHPSPTTSRRGSEASEKMVKVDAGPMASASDDDDDKLQDDETRAHRKKFAEMRGGHYRNEAEAMKRAQALLDEEESSGNDGRSPSIPPPVPHSGVNGSS